MYLSSSKCILFLFSGKRLISKGSNFKLPGSVKVLIAQSCLTLCNPMDCSPPGFSVHRILQARILEWVAISFSRGSSQPRNWTKVSYIAGRFFTIWVTILLLNISKLCIYDSECYSLNRVQLFATPWTVARQANLSMEFSRRENWSGWPFPSPGDPPDPGIEPGSPELQADSLPSEPPGEPWKFLLIT